MRQTQCERIIDYIERFGSITSRDAFADLGITRLAARIFNLEEQGYEIERERVSAYNRFGEKVYFTRYSFPEEPQYNEYELRENWEAEEANLKHSDPDWD